MWAWLNPVNLLKILSLAKALWDVCVQIYNWAVLKLQKQKQEAGQNEIESAQKDLDAANSIENADERLKAKAAAAKRMEDALRNTSNS